jgi:hypothetical protein
MFMLYRHASIRLSGRKSNYFTGLKEPFIKKAGKVAGCPYVGSERITPTSIWPGRTRLGKNVDSFRLANFLLTVSLG